MRDTAPEVKMPTFKVIGRGMKTGRTRTRHLAARDEDHARQLARKDGMDVDSVQQILVTHFHDRVAGFSHRNADGTSRQKIIASLRQGELISLEHEIGNRHDIHAIRVLSDTGGQIGYLSKHLAKDVLEWLTQGGSKYSAIVTEVEVVDSRAALRAVHVLIVVCLPEASDAKLTEYAATVAAELKCADNTADVVPCRTLRSLERHRRVIRTAERGAKAKLDLTSGSMRNARSEGCFGSILLGAVLAVMFYWLR